MNRRQGDAIVSLRFCLTSPHNLSFSGEEQWFRSVTEDISSSANAMADKQQRVSMMLLALR